MPKKLSREEFICRAKSIHVDPCYDYSEVVFENMRKKVQILCHKHGKFKMSPICHTVQKQKCPKCANELKSKNMKLTRDCFIDKANKIHNCQYEYDLVEYIDMKTPVLIRCPEHGAFVQTPSNHIHRKSRCPKCLGRNTTTKDFINKAKHIHGEKFSYDLVDYVNSTTKVKIVCLKHGVFKQTPAAHVNGRCGCPKCNQSKGEALIETILVKFSVPFVSQFKFHDCRRVLPLRFDFFIKKLNTLIEYDGEHHFVFIPRIHKKFSKYKAMKENDHIKTKYCREKGINLIRISYKELNNIPSIIEERVLSFL